MSQYEAPSRSASAWQRDPDTIGPPPATLPPGLGLVTVANVALRHRVRLFVLATLGALLLAVPPLLKPRTYTTTVSFTPQAPEGDLARFNGVAAQLGLALPGSGSSAQSPDFYADLVRSREILRALAEMRFSASGDSAGAVPLPELLKVEAPTPELTMDETIRRLGRMIAAGVDNKTSVITVSVTAPYPGLTRQLAARLLATVNDFNLASRQAVASAERRFIEDRLTAVQRELRESENELQAFLASNRQFSSPQLQLRQQRLQQEVDLRRALFTSLAQSYEQSRIEEVRNTPALQIIEHPEVPVRPDSRRIVIKAMLGVLLGITLGLLTALLQEAFRRARLRSPEEFAHLAQLRRSAVDDLRRPLRLFTRR